MTLERIDDTDECGCAPSPRERRLLWPSVDRRTALGLGAVGLLALGATGGPLVTPAFAAMPGYPSWDDVQRARANESSKAAEVSRIQGLIQGLNAEVERTRQAAEAASNEFYVAQQEFFKADYEAGQLQAQADAEAAKAKEAADKAARLAAQLYRTGGDDTSLELFFSGSAASADDLLSRLGTMDKLVERNRSVYEQAVTARDSARNLSNRAEVARAERDRLQKVAEEKMVAAQRASDAAQAALAEQQANEVVLQAQLAALQDTTQKTVAEYQAGVEAERKAREERERREREEAQRRAEAARIERERIEREEAERRAREAANSGGGGGGGGGGAPSGGGSSGGGGGGGGGGAVVGSGWARPSSGRRTSGYGPRTVQCGSGYCSSGFHYGVDLAAGCWAGIFAAQAGRVTYAGYNGGYGNYIRIDHGNGTGTGYAHIVNGGIYVRNGQWVNAGQQIAAEGNTGNSFGCHLHFEVYRNGGTVNPIDFMASVGVWV